MRKTKPLPALTDNINLLNVSFCLLCLGAGLKSLLLPSFLQPQPQSVSSHCVHDHSAESHWHAFGHQHCHKKRKKKKEIKQIKLHVYVQNVGRDCQHTDICEFFFSQINSRSYNSAKIRNCHYSQKHPLNVSINNYIFFNYSVTPTPTATATNTTNLQRFLVPTTWAYFVLQK